MISLKRKFLYIFISILSTFLICVTPSFAMAGINTDPASGGGGGGGGGGYNTRWEYPVWRYGTSIPEGGGDHAICCYLHVDPIPSRCGEWFRFNQFFQWWNPSPAAVEVPKITDGNLLREVYNNVGYENRGSGHWDGMRVHGYYCGTNGQPIDAVWIDDKDDWHIEHKDVLVYDYTEKNGEIESTTLDERNKSARDLWFGGKQDDTYHHKTEGGQLSDQVKVRANVQQLEYKYIFLTQDFYA